MRGSVDTRAMNDFEKHQFSVGINKGTEHPAFFDRIIFMT